MAQGCVLGFNAAAAKVENKPKAESDHPRLWNPLNKFSAPRITKQLSATSLNIDLYFKNKAVMV
jgi:hypothetical protein